MASIHLLAADGTMALSLPLEFDTPLSIGRTALKIDDKRLSRKQVVVTVASGSRGPRGHPEASVVPTGSWSSPLKGTWRIFW